MATSSEERYQAALALYERLSPSNYVGGVKPTFDEFRQRFELDEAERRRHRRDRRWGVPLSIWVVLFLVGGGVGAPVAFWKVFYLVGFILLVGLLRPYSRGMLDDVMGYFGYRRDE